MGRCSYCNMEMSACVEQKFPCENEHEAEAADTKREEERREGRIACCLPVQARGNDLSPHGWQNMTRTRQ